MRKKVDFLVIGSGLAGLSFALRVAEHGNVCIISKTKLEETNTSYAQGGIAAVTAKIDSYDKHIEDTLIAGDGICNEDIVRMVISEAPGQIRELLRWGINFDKKPNGEFDLNKEGGHSVKRILHHKDNTGYEIQSTLVKRVLEHPKIETLDYYFAVDLITQHHLGFTVTRHDDINCYGAYALNLKTHDIDTILAKTTYIATGGIGNIYQTTTNPAIATGDGIAMVYRAKGYIRDMEFVQFHPTSLYYPSERPSFLITEALRGSGAELKTIHGTAFMGRYDKRGSLAPRDIVARAIDNEMKTRGDDHVVLDATDCDPAGLKKHFPNIYKKCLSIGIDITKEPIPVIPAAHYLCGGIIVDKYGQTTINQLYAGGEAASTGLHGANRLASNSLMEAIVFSARTSKHAVTRFKEYDFNENVPDWNDEGTTHPEEMVLITQEFKELRQIMSNYVGIVRSDIRLKRAFERLEIIYKETENLYESSKLIAKICELRNAINVAYLVIKMASRRKESRGLHYTIDHPDKNGKQISG
jgi:L-aspartate oxidase